MRAASAATGLVVAVVLSLLALSGGEDADPRTPAGIPGLPVFFGMAVIGSGGPAAAVDSYGNVVDLRRPGPAGAAVVAVSPDAQAAGRVDAGEMRVADPPLWHADSVFQHYLPGTNALRTVGVLGGERFVVTRSIGGVAAMRADRRWIARAEPLGPAAPRWARRMHKRSLLVLRALTDRRSGGRRRRRPRGLGLGLAARCGGGWARPRRRRLPEGGTAGRAIPPRTRPRGCGALRRPRVARSGACGTGRRRRVGRGRVPGGRPSVTPRRARLARPRRLPGERGGRPPRQCDRGPGPARALCPHPGARPLGRRPGVGARLDRCLDRPPLRPPGPVPRGTTDAAGARRRGRPPRAAALRGLGRRRGPMDRADRLDGLEPRRAGRAAVRPAAAPRAAPRRHPPRHAAGAGRRENRCAALDHSARLVARLRDPHAARAVALPGAPILAPMKVREATVDDCEALGQGMKVVVDEGRWLATELGTAEEMTNRFAQAVLNEEHVLLALESGDRVVGALGMHPTGVTGVLSMGMWVLPEERGRGGGRRLVAAALEAVPDGIHKLELEVFPDNEAAIALYRSFGFEQEGLRRDHYRRRDGSLRSAVLMARLFD